VGPQFFEETVTAENCTNLLTEFVILLDENERDCWFRRDWATAHTEKTTAFMQELFGDRIVRRGLWRRVPRTAIIEEAWCSLDITLSRLLCSVTKNALKICEKQ
jgi:hypothetical protein